MARRELRPTTQILRAGNAAKSSRYASPVMGDRGPTPLVKGRWPKARGDREGEYGHGVSILSRPPAILKVNCPEGAREGGLGHWFLSHRWERNSPPAGGEIPPAKRAIQRPDEGIGPYKKAFYHRPLIRPLRGHLSLSPLSLRDIIPTPFGLRPFPPDRGNRPLDKERRPPGEGLGGRPSVPPLRVKRNIPWRAADSRPYADTGRGPFSS